MEVALDARTGLLFHDGGLMVGAFLLRDLSWQGIIFFSLSLCLKILNLLPAYLIDSFTLFLVYKNPSNFWVWLQGFGDNFVGFSGTDSDSDSNSDSATGVSLCNLYINIIRLWIRTQIWIWTWIVLGCLSVSLPPDFSHFRYHFCLCFHWFWLLRLLKTHFFFCFCFHCGASLLFHGSSFEDSGNPGLPIGHWPTRWWFDLVGSSTSPWTQWITFKKKKHFDFLFIYSCFLLNKA